MRKPIGPRAEDPMFTVYETGPQLRISVGSVQFLIKTGQLGCVKVGPRMTRIPLSAIKEFLARKTARPVYADGKAAAAGDRLDA